MKKINARNQFNEVATRLGMGQVEPLEIYLDQHEEDLIQQFVACFDSYCGKVAQMQKEGTKEPLSYIHFSLLRTNILAKNYMFRIDSYNKDWYMDLETCEGEYDVSGIFSFLQLYEDALEKERLNYGGQISASDVKLLLLEESLKYTEVITELIRMAIKEAIKLPSYEAVLRDELFAIQVGEFHDLSQTVYKEDRTFKTSKEVIKLLGRKGKEHQYEIFEQLTLQDGKFNELKLAYSSGKKSHFISCQFQKALMIACEFQEATLEQIDFSDAKLLELDFTDAHLEGVNFEGAELHYLNFENATLINIDFRTVQAFQGINLNNATLINTLLPPESEVSE